MGKLADTNLFLFARDAKAKEHRAALGALERDGDVSINAVVASEFLHHASRLFGRKEARVRLDELLVTFQLLPLDAEAFRRAGEVHESLGLSANDSVLAAQALSMELELLSFDGDFRRVKGLKFVHLRA